MTEEELLNQTQKVMDIQQKTLSDLLEKNSKLTTQQVSLTNKLLKTQNCLMKSKQLLNMSRIAFECILKQCSWSERRTISKAVSALSDIDEEINKILEEN